jgi:putative inorganic carbon (hco3(-)) transporter
MTVRLPRPLMLYTPHLLWGGGAILVGLAAGLLSPLWALFLLGLVLAAPLFAITPLAALGIMLVLAPLRTLVSTEAAYKPPLDSGQITFLLYLAAWVISRIVQRQPLLRFKPSLVYVPILIFVVAGGLTAWSAWSLGSWLTEWLKWWIILIMIYTLLSLGRHVWPWVVGLLVTAGIANALVGIYIFFGGSGADHLVILGRFFRAFGTFGQPNPFGGFLGLLTPLALMMAYGYAQRLWAAYRAQQRTPLQDLALLLFYGSGAGLMLAGILMSWSRGAWLGVALSSAVMVFALPRKIWQSMVVTAVLIAVGLMLWMGGLIPASIVNRLTSSAAEFITIEDVRGVEITNENYAVVERLAHWQAATNMATDYPWLGVGLGNYENAYNTYRLMFWEFPLGHAHNYYLNILAEAGIIGILSYLTMGAGLIWLTWRLRQNPDLLIRAAGIGLMGTWTYLAVHSLLDNLYVNNIFLHIGALLGVLAILTELTWSSITWESI